MRFIGITGGVGAGKSEILGYLAQKPDTRVMLNSGIFIPERIFAENA